MKRFKFSVLALALAAFPLLAGATLVEAPAPAPGAPVSNADASSKLSPPAREVLKMAVSGVPDDVIRAYIDSSGSTFNLTSDGIISMQGVGVSTAVTSFMLAHDKAIIDRATAYNPPPPAPVIEQPQAEPMAQPNSVQVTTIPYDPAYYSGLAPYGGWYNDAAYGAYWAPYPGVDWSLYPWGYGYFGGGRWWHHPYRGWCWSPGFGFRGGFGFGGGFGFRDGFGFRGGFGFRDGFGFRGGFHDGFRGGFGGGFRGGGIARGGFGHGGGGFGGRGGHR